MYNATWGLEEDPTAAWTISTWELRTMLGQIRGDASPSDSPTAGASVTTTGTQSPGRSGSELPKEATRTEVKISRSAVPTRRARVAFLRVSQSRAMSVCASLTEQPTRRFSLKAIGNLRRRLLDKLLHQLLLKIYLSFVLSLKQSPVKVLGIRDRDLRCSRVSVPIFHAKSASSYRRKPDNIGLPSKYPGFPLLDNASVTLSVVQK